MATLWNSADKGPGVTLSGGDLTATFAASTDDSVRATASKASGKYYFEVAITGGAVSGFNMGVGVANASCTMTGFGGGFDANAVTYRGSDGVIRFNSTILSTSATFESGDVIGVAFDATAREVKFYKNNVLQYTVASANVPTGALFPVLAGQGNSGSTSAGQGKFSTFTYSPPATYAPFDTTDFSITGTGGVLVGGAATISGSNHLMTGGVKVGGAATMEFRVALLHTMTGGIVVGGEALFEFVQANVYNHVPTGGMQMGGAALVQEAIQYKPTGGMVMGGGALIQDYIPFRPTGGMVMSGVAPISFRASPAVSGGMLMSGVAPVRYTSVITPIGGMVMGGAAVVNAKYPWHMPTGGMEMGGTALAYFLASGSSATTENPYADPFPGWAINLDNFAASRYMGLAANSMTRALGGKTFVSNAGGIYEVGADDDAGEYIHASIQFATTDFANSREKFMEDAYFGVRSETKMRFKVTVNDKEPVYYSISPSGSNAKGTRVNLGKGLRGRYWTSRLDNIDGSDFTLESVEFNPVAGQRHGA